MVIFLLISTLVICSLILLAFFLILGIFTGAPYVGSDTHKLQQIIAFANVRKGDVAVDLGSGDGRILIALAKKGAIVHGFEINPFYVMLSKVKVFLAGVQNSVHVHWASYWNEDLSKFNVITVFGISYIMDRLEKKIKSEAKKGTKVILSVYPFKNWKYAKQKNSVYFYKK